MLFLLLTATPWPASLFTRLPQYQRPPAFPPHPAGPITPESVQLPVLVGRLFDTTVCKAHRARRALKYWVRWAGSTVIRLALPWAQYTRGSGPARAALPRWWKAADEAAPDSGSESETYTSHGSFDSPEPTASVAGSDSSWEPDDA